MVIVSQRVILGFFLTKHCNDIPEKKSDLVPQDCQEKVNLVITDVVN